MPECGIRDELVQLGDVAQHELKKLMRFGAQNACRLNIGRRSRRRRGFRAPTGRSQTKVVQDGIVAKSGAKWCMAAWPGEEKRGIDEFCFAIDTLFVAICRLRGKRLFYQIVRGDLGNFHMMGAMSLRGPSAKECRRDIRFPVRNVQHRYGHRSGHLQYVGLR